MKRLKRIMALVIAMAMVLGMMSMTAFAEDETNPGSITIKSPVLGATYHAYQVFDMTMNEAGDAFSYSIKSDSPFFNAVMKYANMPATGEDADADGLTLIVSADTAESAVQVYSISATEDFDAKEFGDFLELCIENPDDDHPQVTATPTDKTVALADTEKVVFENLPLGYYLILSDYPEYAKTATLEFGDPGTEEDPNPDYKKWTFDKNSTDAQIEAAADEYANLVYPDMDSVADYVNTHGSEFDKSWSQMTDDEKNQVKEDLIASVKEDAINDIKAALNQIAGDESDDNTLTNRLVIVDSTTPAAVVYEKNEIDKWDVPVNPDGSADLPDLPDHGEPDGGKNIIIGEKDGQPIYADWTEAKNGDDIHYQLRINAMNFVRTNPSNTTDTTSSIEQVKEYIIADYQSEALTYDPDQGIKVTIVDSAGNVVGLKDASGNVMNPAADYNAWSDYFFLNDENDTTIANPQNGILGNGGGIVIPWVGVTKDLASLNGNPNYTVSEQPKVDEDDQPVYVHEDVKTDPETHEPVSDGSGHFISVNNNIVDANGNLLDEAFEPIQDKETYYIYSLYPSEVTIVVDYHMTLTDKAAIDGDGNINYSQYGMNYVDEDDYDYTPNTPDDKPDTPPDEPEDDREVDKATVYTYALAFKKVNDKGEALADATFELPFYVKKTADTDGAYIYAFDQLPDPMPEGDSADNYTNSLTTPASGEITIKGIVQGTYKFTETAAPDGYNKLAESFEVEAKKTGESKTTTITRYLDANGNVTETQTEVTVTYANENIAVYDFGAIVNKQGTELPSTGGIGTTIFYVVGAILVLGAGVVLITRRRMDA